MQTHHSEPGPRPGKQGGSVREGERERDGNIHKTDSKPQKQRIAIREMETFPIDEMMPKRDGSKKALNDSTVDNGNQRPIEKSVITNYILPQYFYDNNREIGKLLAVRLQKQKDHTMAPLVTLSPSIFPPVPLIRQLI